MRKANDVCILLVDDEDGIRESIGINLELEDFKVITAPGADDAIEILKTQKIDFVISDVRMPKGDGVKLLIFIKDQLQMKIPVVLMSGFAEIEPKDVKKLGGIDLISKPPDLDELIILIKKTCNCLP